MAKPTTLSLLSLSLGFARAASEIAKAGNRTLNEGGDGSWVGAGGTVAPVGFLGLHSMPCPPIQCACGAYRRSSVPAGADRKGCGTERVTSPALFWGRCGVSETSLGSGSEMPHPKKCGRPTVVYRWYTCQNRQKRTASRSSNSLILMGKLERTKGFEPSTPTLAKAVKILTVTYGDLSRLTNRQSKMLIFQAIIG